MTGVDLEKVIQNKKTPARENLPWPVWLTALLEAGCSAQGISVAQPIAWSFDGEQALYTNSGGDAVVVLPFGVQVDPGKTLAVLWERGETSYSLRHAS